MPFISNVETILESTNIDKIYDEIIERIKENFALLNAKASIGYLNPLKK